eukprot:UN05426
MAETTVLHGEQSQEAEPPTFEESRRHQSIPIAVDNAAVYPAAVYPPSQPQQNVRSLNRRQRRRIPQCLGFSKEFCGCMDNCNYCCYVFLCFSCAIADLKVSVSPRPVDKNVWWGTVAIICIFYLLGDFFDGVAEITEGPAFAILATVLYFIDYIIVIYITYHVINHIAFNR